MQVGPNLASQQQLLEPRRLGAQHLVPRCLPFRAHSNPAAKSSRCPVFSPRPAQILFKLAGSGDVCPRFRYNRVVGAQPLNSDVLESAAVAWEVTLWTHVPSKDQDHDVKDMGLQLTVIPLSGGEPLTFNLDDKAAARDPVSYERFRPELAGRSDEFKIRLPAGFEPAAVKIKDLPDRGSLFFRIKGKFERFFLRRMKLRQLGAASHEVHFMANSYISPIQKDRLFVRNDAWTDKQLRTNDVITKLQEEELLEMRGEGFNAERARKNERVPGDRIYRFAPYNDLGKDPADKKNIRPVLGNKTNPYPRRMDTNRALWDGTEYEKPPTKAGILEPLVGSGLLGDIVGGALPSPWVPEDDNFSRDKGAGFLGNALVGQLPAVLRKIRGISPARKEFDSVAEVLSLYDGGAFEGLIDGSQFDIRHELTDNDDTEVDMRSGFKDSNSPAKFEPIDLVKFDAPRSITSFTPPGSEAVAGGGNDANASTSPDIRLPTWHTDEEFGRMFLAGQNPIVIEAVSGPAALERLLPAKGPSKTSIDDSQIKSLLEGHTFQQLADEAAKVGAESRLLVVDYWAIHQFLPETEADAEEKAETTKKVLHAGRAVLFRRSDGHLVPVAIELAHCQGTPATVITAKDPSTLWLLAKLVFLTIDSGWHQLISHFVRTHACVEPYLIATRRQLPPTHPIFRLMMPHFRYTMPINSAARGILINAGGVIESSFSPGVDSLWLSSKVYGLTWQFKNEGLPADLKKRGILDDDGNIKVSDYPYVQDGLEIWNALHAYFTEYVGHYYASDEEVAADTILRDGWWTDIRQNGHPDVTSGWIELQGRESLVDICCTIAWVASAVHAAVNFGQYDYSAWPVTHASNCRKAMPSRDSDEWKDLAAQDLFAASLQAAYEKLMLRYLSDVSATVTVMATIKLLSAHAEDEQYLSAGVDRQEWLPLYEDNELLRIFKAFLAAVEKIDAEVDARNAEGKSLARTPANGGLGYTLLRPTSDAAGVTFMGVPYSISI